MEPIPKKVTMKEHLHGEQNYSLRVMIVEEGIRSQDRENKSQELRKTTYLNHGYARKRAPSGSKKPNGSSYRTPHWLRWRNRMANGTNIVAGKNRGCGAFHLYMDEFCGGKFTISVQWDHRKAESEENSGSPVNSSRNAKIPSSRRNTFTARTTGVSNPIRSPSFRLSVSVSAQQSAFAVGVLFDLYAFHRSTENSLCPYRTPACNWIIPLECTMVSGPEAPPSDVIRAAKERIKVAIHPEYPEQTIAIGSTLTEEGLKALCELLRCNLYVFAWKPKDMTGVPRHLAEHRLNVRKGCLPVRQKKRSQAPERNKAIQEEWQNL
nr:reverse transcriptase domain-containing protein [Tanacetum cinerariifolium]